jgi:hypothetical protein
VTTVHVTLLHLTLAAIWTWVVVRDNVAQVFVRGRVIIVKRKSGASIRNRSRRNGLIQNYVVSVQQDSRQHTHFTTKAKEQMSKM